MGIEIMKYRSRIIGGKLDVKQGTKGGTEVICTFIDNIEEN